MREKGACALALAGLLAVTACGDYSGGSTKSNTQSLQSTTTTTSAASTSQQVVSFEQTVYPVLTQYCFSCHAGQGPGSPNVAHPDVSTAYFSVVNNQKINFSSPPSSRLVRRLLGDFHHCWSNCASDGAEMLLAVQAFVASANFNSSAIAVSSIRSSDLTLADGIEDLGDERYDDDQIALFDFKEGAGNIAFDTSGVAPAMDLTLEGTRWMSSYGLVIEDGKAQADRVTSRKLYDMIADPNTGSGQFSVEAWMTAANTAQEGPARIVTYSNGTGSRNFTMAQVGYQFDLRTRSLNPNISNNGSPSMQTYDVDRDLQDTLQHVVLTYDFYRGQRIYVDGVWTDDVDESGGDRLWNWDDRHFFVLGNESSNNRLWQGRLHHVAVFNRVLTDEQIMQNYRAGTGKRLIMTFDVSGFLGAGNSLQFVVTELDDYSYLFCEPTYLGNQSGFRVANIRIAVNGLVPVAGQAWRTLDTAVSSGNQIISQQCSVVAKEQGPASDVFTVVFEALGNYENIVTEFVPPIPPIPFFAAIRPDEGIRDFDKVNASMAALTSVDPLQMTTGGNRPFDTFDELRQQLPSEYDLMTFVSSHQVGIAKLSFEYCDVLVEDATLRDAFFGQGFPWNASADVAFAGSNPDLVIIPLVDVMIGIDVADQPDPVLTAGILRNLLTDLTTGCTPASCPAQYTLDTVKGLCTAVIASGAVTIH